MITTVDLVCDSCGQTFQKKKSEHDRCLRRGLKRAFCSAKCCGKGVWNNIPVDKRCRDASHLIGYDRSDEHSPFRWHYRNAKRRNKEFNLDLQYLKEVWEAQDGKCPYTGWQLKNMDNCSYSRQLPSTPDRASLDRIDSSKGYVKGNVQFVSMMAQFAKYKFEDKELYRFCEAVVNKKGQS